MMCASSDGKLVNNLTLINRGYPMIAQCLLGMVSGKATRLPSMPKIGTSVEKPWFGMVSSFLKWSETRFNWRESQCLNIYEGRTEGKGKKNKKKNDV